MLLTTSFCKENPFFNENHIYIYSQTQGDLKKKHPVFGLIDVFSHQFQTLDIEILCLNKCIHMIPTHERLAIFLASVS